MPQSSTVSDLIKATFQWASENRESPAKFTETALQKILFRLKMSLPASNSAWEKLAFYWYKAGAYSEYVTSAIENLVAHDDLNVEENQRYKLLVPSEHLLRTKITHDNTDLDQAITVLKKIVEEINPFSIEDEIDAQYIFLSPSPFYPKFKRDFLPTLRAHFDASISAQFKMTDFIATPVLQRTELLRKLYNASASLPAVSFLASFKSIYFDYETTVSRLLGWQVSERSPAYMELIQLSIKEGDEVWELFALAARILHHDKAYEGRLAKWKDDYHRSLIGVGARIQQFYDHVLGETGEQRFSEVSISKSEFVKEVIKQRESAEILWIRPERKRDVSSRLVKTLGEEIARIPEFRSFVSDGELYSTVLERLNDDQVASAIDETVLPGRAYVTFKRDEELVQRTYKIR